MIPSGGGKELRFSAWLARNAWRGGRRREALGWPVRQLRRGVLAFGASRVGSPFALEPEVTMLSAGVQLEGPLARRDGTPVAGSRVDRRFHLTGEGLDVEERILATGGARGVRYLVPSRATHVVKEATNVRYRLGGTG